MLIFLIQSNTTIINSTTPLVSQLYIMVETPQASLLQIHKHCDLVAVCFPPESLGDLSPAASSCLGLSQCLLKGTPSKVAPSVVVVAGCQWELHLQPAAAGPAQAAAAGSFPAASSEQLSSHMKQLVLSSWPRWLL